MASESAFKIVKILFIFLNVLFFLMGVAMVGIGIYVQITQSNFLALLPKYEYVNVVGVMIAAGIIVLVVTFIGFCGAWMESQCMLIIYFTAVLVVFALEIAVGIIGFIYRDEIDGTLENQLLQGLKDPERRGSWDIIQKQFRCCGVNSASDWQTDASSSVPDSCCQYRGCGTTGMANAYRSGCYTKSQEFIKNNFYTLGAAGIGLGVLQIFLMAIALAMVCCIRKRAVYTA
ncbi:hypothetical protein LOTGIDRAFT_235152 [Lottia gigantea]|uniref:Tetraspanin n=1 Tax=Lottia gigantea TaxID=225164 RepID=V3ZWI3_LOTGI|nr:hypothetical protein LOTGIDRAFT_235152 [Lottia gigantea]ESO86955.1 hypothetical protein LOTGIDRAFT_235152 [Lottia gigantea]